MTPNLTQLAVEQQRQFDATTTPRMRRERGQFGTPPVIADFMAGMFTESPQTPVRILDPGAGVGILSAALCERILRQRSPRHLVFELWENDSQLEACLRRTMEACQTALRKLGYSWKKFSATQINRCLQRRGHLWQGESFDHLVRSPEQFVYLQHYIADNPKRAGLREGEYYRRQLQNP
jgi:hypothetical protein